MENNFLDVNCSKCGNRNMIIPPHKCITWQAQEKESFEEKPQEIYPRRRDLPLDYAKNIEPHQPQKEDWQEQLNDYTGSKEHKYSCTAHSEGQFCCLDQEHQNYDKIQYLIRTEKEKSYQEGVRSWEDRESKLLRDIEKNVAMRFEARKSTLDEVEEKIKEARNWIERKGYTTFASTGALIGVDLAKVYIRELRDK